MVQKSTKRVPPQLIKPYFPESLGHIWLMFLDVSSSRPTSDGVMKPIPYQEIKSYLELTEQRLTPQEVKVLKKLDYTYLEVMNG